MELEHEKRKEYVICSVTIDTLEQLAESEIPVGGWGEEIKRFFQTSLDAAGKKIGSKFEIVADIDDAIARIADGQFAYYENVHFLMHASVHRQMVLLGTVQRNHCEILIVK